MYIYEYSLAGMATLEDDNMYIYEYSMAGMATLVATCTEIRNKQIHKMIIYMNEYSLAGMATMVAGGDVCRNGRRRRAHI